MEKAERIWKIWALGEIAQALYEAAATVFALPPLEILRDPDAVAKWRRDRWAGLVFTGPAVYHEINGREVLIVTDTSQRLVSVRYGHSGRIEAVTVEFPRRGSVRAASKILRAAAEAVPAGTDGGDLPIGAYIGAESGGEPASFWEAYNAIVGGGR